MTSTVSKRAITVPFFRPSVTDAEVEEVVQTVRSGWLTTGPRVKRFEAEFAEAVGARHAVGINSCTAALHLAVEALGLKAGQAVLVPTMTFAATAEVVRYQHGIPILVDCDTETLNLDLADAARKLDEVRAGRLAGAIDPDSDVVGIIPVHVGGFMMNVEATKDFAREHNLWIVEDAAHAFPAAWRPHGERSWQRCGENSAAVSCFSFYANKTITTGEGGMAVTENRDLAERMRMMSLHGLSHDAWRRYSSGGSWDYKIIAPGYKYNLTDIAAALGIHQLARAEEMRAERESIAERYTQALSDLEHVELPPRSDDRIHSWHLFPLKLRLDRLSIDRDAFIDKLKDNGVGCSVHWRPLHLHPYYSEKFGWRPQDLPNATAVWQRLVSLPMFPGMREEEFDHVIDSVRDLCRRYEQ